MFGYPHFPAARRSTLYRPLSNPERLLRFQAIADANDEFYPGTRTEGPNGYADSVAHVGGLLEESGYDVTLDEFEFQFVFRRCCTS